MSKLLISKLREYIGTVHIDQCHIAMEEAAKSLESQSAEIERTERNRDMWKQQCSAQAAELTRLREALTDLFGADMEHFLMLDGKDDQIKAIAKARAALTTKGTE